MQPFVDGRDLLGREGLLYCYRLGVDPWAYFRDVLPKLGDTHFPAARLRELLPEVWAQQQAQQR